MITGRAGTAVFPSKAGSVQRWIDSINLTSETHVGKKSSSIFEIIEMSRILLHNRLYIYIHGSEWKRSSFSLASFVWVVLVSGFDWVRRFGRHRSRNCAALRVHSDESNLLVCSTKKTIWLASLSIQPSFSVPSLRSLERWVVIKDAVINTDLGTCVCGGEAESTCSIWNTRAHLIALW